MSPERIEIIDHQHCGVKGYAKINTGHARITVVQCPGTHTHPQPEENA